MLALFLDPRGRDAVVQKDAILELTPVAAEMFLGRFTVQESEKMAEEMVEYARFDAPPYNTTAYGGADFDVKQWWSIVGKCDNSKLVAKLALLVHTIVPHAAAPERAFSLFDWYQTKKRNSLQMSKVKEKFVMTRLLLLLVLHLVLLLLPI